MGKDETQKTEKTDETEEKKTRKPKPKYFYGLEIDGKGVLSEVEFDSKTAITAYLRDEAKGSSKKDGWIPLKNNRMLKIIHGRALVYQEIKQMDLR